MAKRRYYGQTPEDWMADYNFANYIHRITERAATDPNVDIVQRALRKIVYTYGWNPAKYPSNTATIFWNLVTGDYWGAFKRKLLDSKKTGEEFDPMDADVVKFSL